MKSVINETLHKEQLAAMPPSKLNKTLQQLSEQNKQYSSIITDLQNELATLSTSDQLLEKQITDKKAYIEMLKKQILVQQCECEGECHCPEIGNAGNEDEEEEEKEEGEEEMDMASWMNEGANYSAGLSQEEISCLIEMEYEGSPDQQQICLSCYQSMQTGITCKYLPCSHLFHSECINTHLKVNKLCPACGQQVIMM